jgi:hypothetical protein
VTDEPSARFPNHVADGSDLPNGWRITLAGKAIASMGDLVLICFFLPTAGLSWRHTADLQRIASISSTLTHKTDSADHAAGLGDFFVAAGVAVCCAEGRIAKRIGWHIFRHTYSTLLSERGSDVKVVQELMRHAKLSTTMEIYTHPGMARKRQAQGRVVDALFRRSVWRWWHEEGAHHKLLCRFCAHSVSILCPFGEQEGRNPVI